MGLKGTINKAVGTAFKVLGASQSDGILQAIVYKSVTAQGTFNPTTGGFTESIFINLSFDALVYDVEIKEVDNERIKVGDRRIMFPTSYVSATFKPKLVDSVVIDGTTYVVKDFSQDPAKATWIILLRSP